AARKEYNMPAPLIINPDESDIQQLVDQIRKRNIHYLIVTVHSRETLEIIGIIRERRPEVKMYGTHSFTTGIHLQSPHWNSYNGMTLISAEILLKPEGSKFHDTFQSNYGVKPGLSAYHTYDGTNLIIQAIQHVGLDREAIKEYISETQFAGWATGSISFDELGNRTDAVRFTQIQE
ncbi:MAG: ABC transporter substrate-binding protein, partial [Bacteroidales bacterium]|nr:ABC transporter substrate-binding protein [Bacteroidales bacterium]